ncbi:zona pellucida sperm-binding protein 4-like [Brachionichthys hirsutus]|uniref:zona pellucida sperm-binding protein 4-like n=1 Tax=Brachionichthys hirsutus TaxID=412623 RepID=UPI003604B234
MEHFKHLFGVVVLVLVCDVAAQHNWVLPAQQSQPLYPALLLQQKPNAATPEAPSDKCQVEGREMIQCGAPGVTAEQCDNIDCCFHEQQCYYGKGVTVQCARDGQFVVVVARDATVPHIDVDSVSLLSNGPPCAPADVTSAYIIFQFPVTACGTTFKGEDGYVVYENHMSSSYEVGIGSRGSITRDSHFELLFQCRYSGTSMEALVMEVNAVPPPMPVTAAGPLRVELKVGNGRCRSKGCVEGEVAYSSFYAPDDYPITKVLRELVYIQVSILERSDPNLILNLERCWATSTPRPESLPQWDLLFNGCPYEDDRYLTTLIPVGSSSGLQYPTHHKRFSIKMFAFVDKDSFAVRTDMVFIHCSTVVCYPSSTDSCERSCHRQRRAAVRKVSSSQNALVSSGEVMLTDLRTRSANIKSNR